MIKMIDALLIVIVFRHLALSSAENAVSQSIFTNTGNDDQIFSDDVIMEVAARSRLACASICKATCECDAYTFVKGSPVTSSVKCRLYSGFMAAGSSSFVGARTFAKKKSAWLKKTCTNEADCPGNQTTCHVGQCLCQPAAYYSNGADVCVQSCEQDDLCSTFLAYTGTDIDYDNYQTSYIDLEGSEADLDDVGQCQQHCLDHGNCHAIVHAVGGVGDDLSCWRVKSFVSAAAINLEPWNVYKRTCV